MINARKDTVGFSMDRDHWQLFISAQLCCLLPLVYHSILRIQVPIEYKKSKAYKLLHVDLWFSGWIWLLLMFIEGVGLYIILVDDVGQPHAASVAWNIALSFLLMQQLWLALFPAPLLLSMSLLGTIVLAWTTTVLLLVGASLSLYACVDFSGAVLLLPLAVFMAVSSAFLTYVRLTTKKWKKLLPPINQESKEDDPDSEEEDSDTFDREDQVQYHPPYHPNSRNNYPPAQSASLRADSAMARQPGTEHQMNGAVQNYAAQSLLQSHPVKPHLAGLHY